MLAPPPPPLYTLLAPLGRGGFGEVFCALPTGCLHCAAGRSACPHGPPGTRSHPPRLAVKRVFAGGRDGSCGLPPAGVAELRAWDAMGGVTPPPWVQAGCVWVPSPAGVCDLDVLLASLWSGAGVPPPPFSRVHVA